MGKASRGRRRANTDRIQSWSATAAARDAHRRRDHTLANLPDNPIIQYWVENTLRDGILGLLAARRFLRLGGRRRARRFAEFGLLTAYGLSPPYSDTYRDEALQLLEADIATLRQAEVFVISPSLHRAVVAAALTLTTHDLDTYVEADLPTLHGLLVLPEPLVVRAGAISDFGALSWRPTTVPAKAGQPPTRPAAIITNYLDLDGPVRSDDFTAVRAMATNNRTPPPQLMPDGHNHVTGDPHAAQLSDKQRARARRAAEDLHNRTNEWNATAAAAHAARTTIDAEYAGGVLDDPENNFPARYMFAFFRLCQQNAVEHSRYRDEPGTNNGAGSTIADTRIIRLRGPNRARLDERDAVDPTGRTYKHRWVVRMHKVRQWYPSLGTHKIIWRGPYIKGPDGAPMLTTDKTYAVVR